jgi:sugar lactone lactonase YvrE
MPITPMRRMNSAVGRIACATAVLAGALAIAAATRAVDLPPDPLTTVCGVHDPEDVQAVAPSDPSAPIDLVLVSENRPGFGAISALKIARGEGVRWTEPRPLWPLHFGDGGFARDDSLGDVTCTREAAEHALDLARTFHPHGIAANRVGGVDRVVAVDHRTGHESVDVFTLGDEPDRDTGRRPLVWRACIPMPAALRGNDLTLTDAGDIVVAVNAGTPGVLYLQAFAGKRTGKLIRWRRGATAWEDIAGTDVRAANGVLTGRDGTIYFSESGAGRVWRIRPGTAAELLADVGGIPDNLAWGPGGEILVATHASRSRYARCMVRSPCHAPWAIYGLDPTNARPPRVLLQHDGSVLGGVSAVAFAGDVYVLGAVFGDRVGLWSPKER